MSSRSVDPSVVANPPGHVGTAPSQALVDQFGRQRFEGPVVDPVSPLGNMSADQESHHPRVGEELLECGVVHRMRAAPAAMTWPRRGAVHHPRGVDGALTWLDGLGSAPYRPSHPHLPQVRRHGSSPGGGHNTLVRRLIGDEPTLPPLPSVDAVSETTHHPCRSSVATPGEPNSPTDMGGSRP